MCCAIELQPILPKTWVRVRIYHNFLNSASTKLERDILMSFGLATVSSLNSWQYWPKYFSSKTPIIALISEQPTFLVL